jgi:hypothetical protein
VWYSRTQLEGAADWYQEIGAALRRCNWLVLAITPTSLKSKWVRQEVLYALNERRYDGHIVPLLRTTCDYTQVFWTLGNLQRIDFRPSRPWPDALAELLQLWGMEPGQQR